jgi:hypothetical protein
LALGFSRSTTIPLWALVVIAPLGHTQTNAAWAQRIVRDVRTGSFPELSNADIRVRPFSSDSDYFQARFSILRFFFAKKMQYFIQVNSRPAILTAPDAGIRAIVAHELAHVAYYARGSRLHLFGLLRLANGGFRQRFEKRADTDAIKRGYAPGLKEYRLWLYEHVPAKALAQKKKDYLSPDEIDALARKH